MTSAPFWPMLLPLKHAFNVLCSRGRGFHGEPLLRCLDLLHQREKWPRGGRYGEEAFEDGSFDGAWRPMCYVLCCCDGDPNYCVEGKI